MRFQINFLEKLFPCEYRSECLAKPNITKYQKELYKSCRMIHENNCVSAKLYSQQTKSSILNEKAQDFSDGVAPRSSVEQSVDTHIQLPTRKRESELEITGSPADNEYRDNSSLETPIKKQNYPDTLIEDMGLVKRIEVER